MVVEALAEDGEDGLLSDGEVSSNECGVNDFNGGVSSEVLVSEGGD